MIAVVVIGIAILTGAFLVYYFMGLSAMTGYCLLVLAASIALIAMELLANKKEKTKVKQKSTSVPATSSPLDFKLKELSVERVRFNTELNGIPRAEISVDISASPHPFPVDAMPHVGTRPVGKSFDEARISNLVILDTETTGLDPSVDRIVSLAAIRFENFKPIAAFSTLINPHMPIPDRASKINGLTDADVAEAPSIEQVAASFTCFVGNSAIAGYNLPFDLRFLWASGIDLVTSKRAFYDVLPLCRKNFKDEALDSYRLDDVAAYCGVYREDAHNSLSDCLTTAIVFESVIEKIKIG